MNPRLKESTVEKFIKANGIELAYQEFGDQTHPAMLLIMGLGAQMIYWPEAFCQGLADRGYHVIRFDNRDVGLSHKLEGEKPPGFFRIIEAPTLVIHGKEDPLVPLEAGVDTARHISGAKIELIDGMGHDMPGPLLPKLVELIASHADMATNES